MRNKKSTTILLFWDIKITKFSHKKALKNPFYDEQMEFQINFRG